MASFSRRLSHLLEALFRTIKIAIESSLKVSITTHSAGLIKAFFFDPHVSLLPRLGRVIHFVRNKLAASVIRNNWLCLGIVRI